MSWLATKAHLSPALTRGGESTGTVAPPPGSTNNATPQLLTAESRWRGNVCSSELVRGRGTTFRVVYRARIREARARDVLNPAVALRVRHKSRRRQRSQDEPDGSRKRRKVKKIRGRRSQTEA